MHTIDSNGNNRPDTVPLCQNAGRKDTEYPERRGTSHADSLDVGLLAGFEWLSDFP